MRRTTIYCGTPEGRFHAAIESEIHRLQPRSEDYWWFPEIDHGCRGGPIARHPARIIELVPDMIGRKIVTVSEHIILAFQQLVRQRVVELSDIKLYCGNSRIRIDTDGDLCYWIGGFFSERLELLR